jgi:RHS repeat-associated protein
LGTPQEISDASGRICWSASYDVYGRIERLWSAEVENMLRFPGQYADCETSLHYNRYRYYDPDTGRYLTQDPLWLYGGLNLYRYAPNPLTWVDPLGLQCTIGNGIEIRKGNLRIRIFYQAPGGRFDILAIRRAGNNIFRAEIHPITAKLPQWLRLPHVHLDWLGPRWAHTHLPWEIRPQGLNDFLRRLGL